MRNYFFLVLLILPFFVYDAFGHGVGSETLPPQMIGNYNSTIFLKSWSTVEESGEKQVSMAIYDVGTGDHLHNVLVDFTVSKHGNTLFSDSLRIEEVMASVVWFSKENLTVDETLEKMFGNILEFGADQIQVGEDIFAEGGLYDFDIIVRTVDSFENELSEPVYFKGAISIPKKYEYQTEEEFQVSITTYYDIIKEFSITEESATFLMPFVWSEDNIAQTSVIHEEIHIPKAMSSWIANSYDLKINGEYASNSLITVDDYSVEEERIIHIILPPRYLPEFQNDVNEILFEMYPSKSNNLPMISPTTNNQFDISLSWKPENIVWGTPIIFDILIEDTFTPENMIENIPFEISLVQDEKVIYQKTIQGVKNTEAEENSFQFLFYKEHEGTMKLIISGIDSNEYAQTEFVFVVKAPLLKFPITVPSQSETNDGSFDVDFTWIPADILPSEESEFIFTTYEKDTRIPVMDAYYEFVLIKDNKEIFREAGIAPAGGDYKNYVFSEEEAGQIQVKIDKINKTTEYAEISVNVVPEFGIFAPLILVIGIIGVVILSKNQIQFLKV